MVEDGVEEGLGLARVGAGGDDGRLGAVAALGGQAHQHRRNRVNERGLTTTRTAGLENCSNF